MGAARLSPPAQRKRKRDPRRETHIFLIGVIDRRGIGSISDCLVWVRLELVEYDSTALTTLEEVHNGFSAANGPRPGDRRLS